MRGEHEFTGKDRVRAAYRREFTDRVPAYPILGSFNARFVDCNTREYLTDPRKFAQAQVCCHERFCPDVIVMLCDLSMEAEALGAEFVFPDEVMCYVRQPLLEEKSQLAKLKLPDPKRDGRLPYYLEACERVVAAVKDSAIGGIVCGPWTIAMKIRGAEELLRDTFRDPAFVHELLGFTSEVTRTFGAAVSETGVGISLSEAPASCSLISPKIYQQFLRPQHESIVSFFKDRRTGITMHVCGYIDPIMEDLVATGISALSLDAPSSLQKMVDVNQQRAVLIGNVPTGLFQEGTREQMEEAVKQCLESGASGSAFILSSGCEVPPDALEERVDDFFEAARKYGAYRN